MGELVGFIDFNVTKDCMNLEDSFGEICAQCNRCGRFDGRNKKEVGTDGPDEG